MKTLQIKGIEKRFKGYDQWALKASFSMDQPQLISLLGPSGCGKTTLLRIIAGLTPPDGGEILLKGRNVTETPPHLRRMGLVFQHYSLFPHLTVEQNIHYPMKIQRLSPSERRHKTERLLSLVHLEGYGKRSTNTLSGGEKQRIAIARALAADPEVLLFDEPLSALDTPLRLRLRRQIRTIQKETGLPMLYVTHDQEEALAVSDRIIVMDAGRLVGDADPREIFKKPPSPEAARVLGKGSLIPWPSLKPTPALSPSSRNDTPPRFLYAPPEALALQKGPGRHPLGKAQLMGQERRTEGRMLYFLWAGETVQLLTSEEPPRPQEEVILYVDLKKSQLIQ